jgi:hypothetical protein
LFSLFSFYSLGFFPHGLLVLGRLLAPVSVPTAGRRRADPLARLALDFLGR